jgi:NAD+ synthase (glutamine-hydrolysing)
LAQTIKVMAGAPADGAPLDITRNTRAILARVAQARAAGAQVLLLPPLCLCGHAGDLLTHARVLRACREAAGAITKESQGMLVVFGLPLAKDGQVYNALAIALNGRIARFVYKRTLNRADLPHFQAGDEPGALVDLSPIGLDHQALICFVEDMKDAEFSGASLVLAAAARPARAGELAGLPDALSRAFSDMPAVVYANAGANESTTDAVYPGDAVIVQKGQALSYAPAFERQMASAVVALEKPGKMNGKPLIAPSFKPHPQMPYAPKDAAARAVWCDEALEIAARALATRMQRIGIKAVTLGISGGLDSTMALLICLRAFEILGIDKAGIYGISLPALGTSNRTKDNAWRLMEAAGLTPREIPLHEALVQHFKDIEQPADRFDAAFENAQARERTQVLMDKANQVGGMMVGSGDLSELALGFTTFGGDHMSMYGVNGGLYKTAIRLIIRQYAQATENPALRQVLLDILDTPISPELLSGTSGQITQKTEDILGPYLLTDFFLHHFLAQRLSPADIYARAVTAFDGQFAPADIKTRLRDFFRRFFANQFKRNCLPDGPAPLGVSLSPRDGFNMPSDAAAALYLDDIDHLE